MPQRGVLTRIFSLAAAVFSTTAAVVSAQTRASLDASGARITFDSTARISGVTLAPSLQWASGWTGVQLAGSYADFGTAGWSAQAAAAASTFRSLTGTLHLELGASGSLLTSDRGTWGGRILPLARVHRLWAGGGLYAGGTYGRAHDTSSPRTQRSLEAGAWLRRGTVTLSASAGPTWVGTDLRFTELLGSVRVEQGRLDLAGWVGVRGTTELDVSRTDGWIGATAALQVAGPFALVASVGTSPEDPGLALPGARTFTAGVRLTTPRRGPRAAPPLVTQPLVLPRPEGRTSAPDAPVEPRLSVGTALADGLREVVVTLAEQDTTWRVELMGDVTEWEPVTLYREAPGRYARRLALGIGPQRLVIRINGGPWIAPRGTVAVEDDFGGTVGRVLVQP